MPRVSVRGKDGQVSVLIAAFVALAMVMLAFGIDIAHVLVEKRHAQNQADAAALAAGRFLPLDDSGPPCQAIPNCRDNVGVVARDYSEYNGGPAGTGPAGVFEQCTGAITTNCYDTPYKGHKYYIQIRIHDPVHLWFAGVVPGLAGAIKGVNAKAVGTPGAQTTTTTTPGGIVVSTDPGTIVVSTSPDVVTTTTTPGGVTTTTTPGGVSTTTIPGGVSTTTIPGATHTTTIPGATHTTTTPSTAGSGEAFAMSRQCDAITYTGAGPKGVSQISIGAVATNGGLTFQGFGNAKKVDSLGYDQVGCPNNPARPPSGTSQCTDTSNNLCVKTLIDLQNHNAPLNWPLPPPPLPQAEPAASWNPATDYGLKCIDLGPTPPTINASWQSSHQPGVYCSTNGATLNIGGGTTDLTGGQGYTFFALGGGQINVAGNSTKLAYYWPSACGPRPTNRLSPSFTCFGRTIIYDSYTLLYATSTAFNSGNCALNAICMNGQATSLEGDGFAPNSSGPTPPSTLTQTGGGVFIAGGGASAGTGFFESWEFSVQGNDGIYSGNGPGAGGQVLVTTDPSTTTVSTDPDTVTTSTTPGSTVTTTTPGSTVTTTTPGGTTTTTTPGTTTVTVIPGNTTTTTTPPITQTQTTGTTVALNE